MRKPNHQVQPMLLSPREVATMIGFSRSKTYEMIRDGEIPHIVLGGLIRVRLKDLQALIDGGTRRH
jgi:excisionase family DNA binding protein